jgi:hypothetical protein
LQVAMILGTPCLLAAGIAGAVRGVARWKEERWRCLIPWAAVGLAMVLAPEAGIWIRNRRFLQVLPHYESILREMDSGRIPVTSELGRIPGAEGPFAEAVLAQRTQDGLHVEFLSGGGFPLKHHGYLYLSTGLIEPKSPVGKRWPNRYELRPRWYRISD